SGDGIVGFLSGAEFRVGRESRDTHQEKSAPEHEDKRLLGSSIYFMSKDAGKPVRFIPPSYAIDLKQTNIPKFRRISPWENGPEFWWIEYGGLLDTIHQAPEIKWELWGVVYGVWDYIKNSGCYEHTEGLTLEWVGLIPGKRESRRFMGDYILAQNDILAAQRFYDAAAVGGWPIDVHPAEGVYAKENACSQEHPPGVYTIPYRCYYSRNIENLFLAGRLISCSHLAFGSTRVMGTCAAGGQAVGAAAYLCTLSSCMPREISSSENAAQLQRLLLRENQDLHWRRNDDPYNAAARAQVTASSWRKLKGCIEKTDAKIPLQDDLAIMFPVVEGRLDSFTVPMHVLKETTLQASFWTNDAGPNYSPNQKLFETSVSLPEGDRVELNLQPEITLSKPSWIWFILRANEWASAYQAQDKAVGVIALKPERPRKIHHEYDGELIWKPRKCEAAFSIAPEQDCYRPQNVVNGYNRPFQTPNLWSSERYGEDNPAWIELRWEQPQRIRQIDVVCNSDLDNPLETVLVQHSDFILEETLKDVNISIQNSEGQWRILKQVRDNHHTVIRSRFEPIEIQAVKIECLAAHPNFPYAEIYEIRAYSEPVTAYAKHTKTPK
ncbi:MAG: FAD-dependent oxidoreductase, partial [Candidatus Hinthialibacter sp.]